MGITLPAASILTASFTTLWISASEGRSERQRETVSETKSEQELFEEFNAGVQQMTYD